MTDINIHKFYRNIKTGMFDFFSKNILKHNKPVVVVKLATNVTSIMFDVLLETGLIELHDVLNNPETLVQLEGAARIFTINPDGTKTSALFSHACLGKFIPDSVIADMDHRVKTAILDYETYVSDGIVLGTKVNKRKMCDIGFMKSRNPINCTSKSAANIFNNIIDNVFSSIEYGLLFHIYEMKLDQLTPKAAAKFKKQIEAIEGIRGTDMTYDEMYLYVWNNPFLESLTVTGIMAGMVKVYSGSNSLPHNAVTNFIHLYNQNNR